MSTTLEPSPSPTTTATTPAQDPQAKDQSPVASVSSSQSADTSNDNREASSSRSPSSPAEPEDGRSSELPASSAESSAGQGDWQAIWSPQHNAYYFYNSRTNETTWANPLAATDVVASATVPSPAEPEPSSSNTHVHYDAQEAALAQGIDPELAYLDPSLAAGPSNPSGFTYTAKFNARTGAFAKPDARNPDHVSEYERAKRMSQFYFDVSAWEKDVEARKAEEEETGKKRKKPTKKDLEMFKERKKQKKIAKTAWLRT